MLKWLKIFKLPLRSKQHGVVVPGAGGRRLVSGSWKGLWVSQDCYSPPPPWKGKSLKGEAEGGGVGVDFLERRGHKKIILFGKKLGIP